MSEIRGGLRKGVIGGGRGTVSSNAKDPGLVAGQNSSKRSMERPCMEWDITGRGIRTENPDACNPGWW